MKAMNHIVPKHRLILSSSLLRGIRNGLHAPGYIYSCRDLELDPTASSVERAFRDVGQLLTDATSIEGVEVGKKTKIPTRKDHTSRSEGPSGR